MPVQTPYFPVNSDIGAVVTLAAASASGNSAQLKSGQKKGVNVLVNITAITGTSPTLTVTIEGYDSASGTYYTLLESAALSAVGATLLTVYPGVTATANVSDSGHLPEFWQYYWSILEASRNLEAFGFASSPAVQDTKRTQVELASIAVKKTMTFLANYYQGTSDTLSRNLIVSADFTPILE